MRPRVELLDWGTIDYPEALERQRTLFDSLIAAKNAANDTEEAKVAVSANSELSASTTRDLFGLNRSYGARGERLGDTARSQQPEANRSRQPEANGQRLGDTARSRQLEADKAGWIVLCEHPPVYTLGRSGRSENLLVSETVLREKGATLHRTERGGDITYHGPGQIVAYPILDLDKSGLGLREYITALEQAVIETVAAWGIEAGRAAGKTGVWLGGSYEVGAGCDVGEKRPKCEYGAERKICAIGVRASRGVVMHGLALNVATDLGWFEMINPCGFVGGAVTSMERETGQKIALEDVKRLLAERLKENLRIII